MKNLGLNYAKPLNFPPRCKKSFVTFLLNLKNVNHLFLCIFWELLNRIFRHSDPCLIEESIKIAAWTTLNQTKQCFEIFFSRKTKTTRFFVGGLNFLMLSHIVFHSNKFALVFLVVCEYFFFWYYNAFRFRFKHSYISVYSKEKVANSD